MFLTVPSSEGKGGQLAFCLFFSFGFQPSDTASGEQAFYSRLDRETAVGSAVPTTSSSVQWWLSYTGESAVKGSQA